MLRRNPLAALSLQQPSIRTPSMMLSDDVPFQLDEDTIQTPDGMDTIFIVAAMSTPLSFVPSSYGCKESSNVCAREYALQQACISSSFTVAAVRQGMLESGQFALPDICILGKTF